MVSPTAAGAALIGLIAAAADPKAGRRVVVCTDFDGTLAPILLEPAAVIPAPGAVEALVACADAGALVVIVTGRPASFVAARLGIAAAVVEVCGLYGLERLAPGAADVETHPLAAGWRAVVAEAVRAAIDEAPDGVLVEPKGLAVAVHYRGAPSEQGWVEAWTVAAAARTGLVAHAGRMHVELRPPLKRDKGSVVEEVGAGHGPLVFLGDDLGDVPALEALATARAAGRVTGAVVVASDEADPRLAALADVVVADPAAAVAWLDALAAALVRG